MCSNLDLKDFFLLGHAFFLGFFFHVRVGHQKKEENLQKHCDIDCQNKEGETALMLAVCHGHNKDIVETLLVYNCNLDLQSNKD